MEFQRGYSRDTDSRTARSPDIDPETPAERFEAHLHRATLNVDMVQRRLDALASEKDPNQWDARKGEAVTAIAAAESELTAARAHRSGAPDGVARLAAAETALEQARARVAATRDRPDGIERVALEDDLLAIHARALSGDRGDLSHRDWAQEINGGLKDVVSRLAPEDWDRLRRRMVRPAPDDKLAAWMATRPIKGDVATLAGDGKARVQQKARLANQAATQDQVHEQAATGVATPAQELPHRERLEDAFGMDLGGVRAHVGGGAEASAAAMGAEAYARGDDVVLPSNPSVGLVAHEVTHVLQQRDGVQLKGGVGAVGDAYEQQADAVAHRVERGESVADVLPRAASSSARADGAVQRRVPYGDAIAEAEDVKREDIFPGPVKISVLGDPFEVRIDKRGDALAVTYRYLGPHPVEVSQLGTLDPGPGNAITLLPTRRPSVDANGEPRSYNARVVAGRDDGVTYDLYGDGTSLLELVDRVDPEELGDFDRRKHWVVAKLNGYPTMPSAVHVHLPTGAGKDTDPQERVVSTKLELAGDAFTLRLRRHGDADRVVVSVLHGSGDDQVLVPLPKGAPSELSLAVLRNDGRDIQLDLDGDGKADVSLVHTMRLSPAHRRMRDPANGRIRFPMGPGDDLYYTHHFAAYDADGVRAGTVTHKIDGWGSVPPGQDEHQAPAPEGAAMPADRAAEQDDIPGETPLPVQHESREWELRVDSDGDRTKDVLLRFVPGSEDAAERTYALTVVQLSSRTSASLSFKLSAEDARQLDAFGPHLAFASDGEGPAVIQLGNVPSRAPYLWFQALPMSDPQYVHTQTTYRAQVGGRDMLYTFPHETRDEAPLDNRDPATPPPRARQLATIQTLEVELSEFRDRFRFTVEKVDSGNVLFGVSALGPEGPVGGFSTRLIGIDEPLIDQTIGSTSALAFNVDRNDMLSSLKVTSAIDPPKDQQGRVIDGPPSVYRDHRLTLRGQGVADDREHTFAVREGRFVGGWEKSRDNRRAAAAAQAVGVLEEQAKHPQLGEFRVQIDAALDAEIKTAEKRGWIDGLAAEAWNDLREDMVFIQAQASSGEVDDERADRAAEASEMVGEWMSRETHDIADWQFTELQQKRAAPGTPRTPIPLGKGYGVNPITGETWVYEDAEWVGLKRQGHGANAAKHLRAEKYEAALKSYQSLRDGLGLFLGKKFENDPEFGKKSPEAQRMSHLVKLGQGLGEIEKVQAKTIQLDGQIDAEVAAATARGLVPKAVDETWRRLRDDMIAIGGQAGDGVADKSMVERAGGDTQTIEDWLQAETTGETRKLPGGAQLNPYADSIGVESVAVITVRSNGVALRSQLESSDYAHAVASYRKFRNGVVKWIAEKTQRQYGKDSAEYKTIDGLQRARESRRDVVRVPATFIADESYEKKPDKGDYKQADFGKYKQIPLQLFVWCDGEKWHIRDLHNTNKPAWEGSVDYNGEEQPPHALFEELDHKEHLPKGDIHYHLPDGGGGTVRCKYEKEWYDWVADIALVLAAVGLILVTLGAATPLVVGAYATAAFAASAVLGAIASAGQLADGLHHGFADDTMIMLNVLDIVSSAFSLGAMGAGKLAMGAARAAQGAKAGTQAVWTGGMAKLARAGSLVYRPLLGVSVAADGLSLLVMSDELAKQMDAIDETVKDPHDRMMAKMRLLAQAAVGTGLVILSIRGDLPDLRSGAPHLVLDQVGGVTVARVANVKLGETDLALPEAKANVHAAGRWQTEEIEHDALGGQARAKEMLGDDEFAPWYAKWLQQDDKVIVERGRTRVKAPEGAPDEVVRKLEDIVKQGDMAMYEGAFARADDIAALRAAAGDLDIDPNGAGWDAVKPQLVAKLGGDRRAKELVGRYERARLGGSGDFGSYAKQRSDINKVVPDTELERIRSLFPEHEVFITGKPGVDHVEVAVVVKNGTDPEVMYAIEQRAQGHVVRADPDYVKAHPEHDGDLRLRAKVMTEDQFFGMATASVKGSAPSYHRIGDDLGRSLGLGNVEVRPQGDGRFAVDADQLKNAHTTWKDRDGGNVSKLKYDAETNTTYFEIHGKGKGTTVRIEAALPPRITTASDLKQPNRIVGTRVFAGRGDAEDVLRHIVAGDVQVLTRELGVPLPKGFSTKDDGLEFGLGRLPDGRYVIVRGEPGAVDWNGLPGVKGDGHTHPSTSKNDLQTDDTGQQRVSLESMKVANDDFHINRSLVFPTGADIHYVEGEGINGHRVFTPFVVKDGFVMKPDAGWTGDARLEFVILNAHEVGHHAKHGVSIHRATIVGTFEGKEVIRAEVHAVAPNPDYDVGVIYLKEPPGFVANAPAVKPSRPRRTRTGIENPQEELDKLRGELSDEAKAELDELSAGKTPEATWQTLKRNGDPKRFLEGMAKSRADAAVRKAAAEKRIADADQRLRDTGFFAKPLVKDAIADGAEDALRGHLAEHLAKTNAEKEFAGKTDHVVYDDIDVAKRFGTFKTIAEAKAADPKNATKPLFERDGAVWQRLTDIDVLVLKGKEVVRYEEVKAGASHSDAKRQQQTAIDAFEAIARGDDTIRLFHHRHTDITAQIDATTATPASAKTTGPDNRKGFELKLGVTSDDLDKLVKAILEEAKGTAP